jgi:copper chaperone CopZ
MKKVFYVRGLSCKKGKDKIFNSLSTLPNIESIKIKIDTGKVYISSKEFLSEETLKEKLKIAGEGYHYTNTAPQLRNVLKKKVEKYYPLFTILASITLASLFFCYVKNMLNLDMFMQYYMAFFFLVFGGIKFINPKKFAEGFALYDPIASKSSIYAKLYPLVEFVLGLIYLLNLSPLFIPNIITVIIFTTTNIGIYKVLKQDKEFQCSCLGGFLNLPISWVTLFENLVMIAMALYMLV